MGNPQLAKALRDAAPRTSLTLRGYPQPDKARDWHVNQNVTIANRETPRRHAVVLQLTGFSEVWLTASVLADTPPRIIDLRLFTDPDSGEALDADRLTPV